MRMGHSGFVNAERNQFVRDGMKYANNRVFIRGGGHRNSILRYVILPGLVAGVLAAVAGPALAAVALGVGLAGLGGKAIASKSRLNSVTLRGTGQVSEGGPQITSFLKSLRQSDPIAYHRIREALYTDPTRRKGVLTNVLFAGPQDGTRTIADFVSSQIDQ
ncbi:hypothetical protein HZC35_03525 [Candidatus Saganbacteria bacterium]|nr:hypothetical protein [Candidatus Saganbacteria bacterium]